MAAVTTFLATRGLSKRYGALEAVRNVDFTLREGEVHALIGPNGAGKTTLVGMLCGRIPATSGKITFLDRDISDLPAHRRISLGMAYTFQVTSIFSRLSLHENVALAVRRWLRHDAGAVDREALAALQRVGLAERATQIAGDLSYGHQRLLEIAMGLAQRPKLLILDEPTQGLADGEIVEFRGLIGDLADRTTILLIEHNMDVVMQAATRVTVMNAGTILAEGTPEEIQAHAGVQAAYLGKPVA